MVCQRNKIFELAGGLNEFFAVTEISCCCFCRHACPYSLKKVVKRLLLVKRLPYKSYF